MASTTAAAGAAGAGAAVAKALARVQTQLDAGAFYEAQQMYKTTYHRYRSRRQLDEAYAVLRAGAVAQLRAGQLTCGAELAGMLVDAYTEDRAPAAGANVDALLEIVRAMPAGAAAAAAAATTAAPSSSGGNGGGDAVDEAAVDACSRFVGAAVKWAHKGGADVAVRQLHEAYAAHLTASYGWRALGRASMHYARGGDADAFAAALAAASAAAPQAEAELFLARGVLQTLACAHPATLGRQLSHAQALLDAGRRRAWGPDGRQLGDGAPLVHFAGFLLTALQQRSARLVALLRVKYAAALARDAALEAYLGRVEELYLGSSAAGGFGGGGGGLLGGLLRGLLEGDEEA